MAVVQLLSIYNKEMSFNHKKVTENFSELLLKFFMDTKDFFLIANLIFLKLFCQKNQCSCNNVVYSEDNLNKFTIVERYALEKISIEACYLQPIHSCTKRGSNLKNFSHTKSIQFQSTHAWDNSKLRILEKSTDGPLR